ncbi:family A1 protease [Mycena leptocephala]|nr:family A1 protease [Mycena leptocephala]
MPRPVEHDFTVTYTASVGFGSPAPTGELLIDTGKPLLSAFHVSGLARNGGSSNTWVLMPPYKETSTYKDAQTIRMSFLFFCLLWFPISSSPGYYIRPGDCKCNEYTDQVTFGPNLVIKDQSIGVAREANDMAIIDIIGIGPVDLTKRKQLPTFIFRVSTVNRHHDRRLFQRGRHPDRHRHCDVLVSTTSRRLPPTRRQAASRLEDLICTGEINYVPITKTSLACEYWGYDQSISYGGKEIMATSAYIADTGTTLIMIPTQTFNDYKQATGATCDEATGLLTVTAQQYECMQSMTFTINGNEYELTKNGQIWPRCMNETLGGQKDQIYLVFADMGHMSNPGYGYTFLQRFYSVYDTTNCQIGFATTEHTMATTN